MRNLLAEHDLAETQALTFELSNQEQRQALILEEIAQNSNFCMAYFMHYLSTDLHREFLNLLEKAITDTELN